MKISMSQVRGEAALQRSRAAAAPSSPAARRPFYVAVSELNWSVFSGTTCCKRCECDEEDELVMNSRRLIGSPPQGPHITTPLRENAGAHHSKIDRRMAEMGQSRRMDTPPFGDRMSASPPKADK